MIDLTVLSDSELSSLFQRICAERDRRVKFREAKKTITEITQGYLDAGGSVEELKQAVDEGEAAKVTADSEKLDTISAPVEPAPTTTTTK